MKLFTQANVLAAFALVSLTAFAADTVKIDGWVSDSKCGAMHNASGPDQACVAKCIKQGAKPVFVDDAKGAVWTIDDPDAVQNHYGHHIQATMVVDPDKKVVHITHVTMLADQGKKSGDGMDMGHN
jgi:hypothetical protein